MKMQREELLRERGEWMIERQQITQCLNDLSIQKNEVAMQHNDLSMEKDELIRQHTLETAELRKKNNILKEAVEKLERQAKLPAASNLPNEFTNFDSMDLDAGWENYPMVSGLQLDGNPPVQQTHSLVPNDKAPDITPTSDYPFSWNAFYMCLLFGAFIASNGTSLSARSVPQLSEEYRAESANVLKAVLSSSPPELSQTNQHMVPSSTAPLPSTISGAEMANLAHMTSGPTSSLDDLHNSLAMPTEQQEQEQVFALNPDQYNSLTTLEDSSLDYRPPQQPSNLQQALAAMRNNAAQNKMHNRATSDVYTRSVMWDHVPEKVIRDFRRMVNEYSSVPVKEEDRGFFD